MKTGSVVRTVLYDQAPLPSTLTYRSTSSRSTERSVRYENSPVGCGAGVDCGSRTAKNHQQPPTLHDTLCCCQVLSHPPWIIFLSHGDVVRDAFTNQLPKVSRSTARSGDSTASEILIHLLRCHFPNFVLHCCNGRSGNTQIESNYCKEDISSTSPSLTFSVTWVIKHIWQMMGSAAQWNLKKRILRRSETHVVVFSCKQ